MGHNENGNGFGVTGNPAAPYNPRYGADTYYPANADNLAECFQEAQKGLEAFHRYAATLAMTGNLRGMIVWDKLNESLNINGLYGFHPHPRLPKN